MAKMMIYHTLMGASLAMGANRETVWGVDMLVKTIDGGDEKTVNYHKSDGWHNTPQGVIDEIEQTRLAKENQGLKADIGDLKTKKELDDELARLKAENDRLKQEIADLTARLAVYETAQDGNKDGSVSFDEMTADQLKAYLDGKGIKYDKRTGKDGLIALAVGADGAVEQAE